LRKKKKMFKEIAYHLNSNGILSFTTELIIKYEKKPIFFYIVLRKILCKYIKLRFLIFFIIYLT